MIVYVIVHFGLVLYVLKFHFFYGFMSYNHFFIAINGEEE